MFRVSLNYAFIEVAVPGLKREMSTRALFFLGFFFGSGWRARTVLVDAVVYCRNIAGQIINQGDVF